MTMRFKAMGTGILSLLKKGYQKIIQGASKDRRILAEMDYFRLHALLTADDKDGVKKKKRNRNILRQILKHGNLFPFKLVPNSVVTMNSEIQMRTPKGKIIRITLVYPRDENRKKGKISVLSFLGLSILGKQAGETVSRSWIVESVVFQPESFNRFAL